MRMFGVLIHFRNEPKMTIIPHCVAYGCDNDIQDAPREVSFHTLPLKKPAVLKQDNGISTI